MARIRILLASLGFAAAILAGSAIALVQRDPKRLRRLCARLIAALSLPALGLRLRYTGLDHLHARRPCIVVANHQSLMDYPVLARIFPEDAVVVGRTLVGRIPLVGRLYRTTLNIVIDRESKAAAIATLNAEGERAAARGEAVLIFPEGTRNPRPGTLLPFKRGAFHLACRLGVPVVPVVVGPLWPALRGEGGRRVEVRALEPVEPEGMDPAGLADRVRERMLGALEEVRRA